VFVLFVFVLLSVSLDCPFLIAPSMFSNIYKTNMVNNSTDINKTNVHLSREITEHKIARHTHHNMCQTPLYANKHKQRK
jgi:hypothetical protein